jgi:4'-phosphopantetheinyl transferase
MNKLNSTLLNTIFHSVFASGKEAHLWLVSTDNLPETSDEKLLLQLSPEEQIHYNALRMPKVKREYLITRALVRNALSYYADVAPLEWEFVKDQHGRPHLTQQFSKLKLNFNITHSRGAVACLIACGHQLGVDIEPLNRKADFVDIAENVLTSFEQTALNEMQKCDGASKIDFLHYWTLKEAYSKALGLGLSMHFKDIVCVFDCVEPDGFAALQKEKWQFLQAPILNNHLLAIAIGKATPDDVAIRLMDCGHELENVQPGLFLENASGYVPRLFVKP